jgi:hypothetical protein
MITEFPIVASKKDYCFCGIDNSKFFCSVRREPAKTNRQKKENRRVT